MKNKRNVFNVLDVVIGSAILSSLFVLLNATGVYADVVDTVTVTVPVSCSMTSIVSTEHTTSINVGTYEDEIGETTFKVLCNDTNGFAVYAIGYSNDEYGNTTMKPATLSDSNGIITGTATSGSTSNWAMKLAAVSGDFAPTLATGFDAYHAVPDEYTKVASLSSSTDATIGSSFKSTYAAFISHAQAADTYVGKVKYTVVHPANEDAPEWRTYMQNLDSLSCTSTPSVVYDNRDNHAYTIQRLLDGNCWMMENLDLGRTELTTDLTSANTNLATTVTASTFNSWKKTSGTATYNAGEFIPIDGTGSTAGTPYGTLYNYFAASAGTISGNSNSNNAEYDICPAGWRLPTGGGSGEFQALYDKYNSYALMTASIEDNGAAFVNAGYFTNSTPAALNNSGGYLSLTKYDSNSLYIHALKFNIIGQQVFPASNATRSTGYSIRCILKEFVMQDVSSWGSSIQEGEEVIAKDKRDGKLYTVARLADGNLWMTQNLDHDIDATKTYTPADTDIPANWTPSTSTYATGVTTWNNSRTTPESYDPGDLYWNGTLDTTDVWNDYFSNGGDNPASTFTSITGNSHYHLGNYYNWTATVAMNDSSSYDTDGTLIDQSICPAGWTLPRAGYGDDTFYALVNEYDTWDSSSYTLQNNTELWTSPTYFSLSGDWNGSLEGVGYGGAFWSSVVSGGISAYSVALFSGGNVRPCIVGVGRGYNASVRCIARPVTNQIVTDLP